MPKFPRSWHEEVQQGENELKRRVGELEQEVDRRFHHWNSTEQDHCLQHETIVDAVLRLKIKHVIRSATTSLNWFFECCCYHRLECQSRIPRLVADDDPIATSFPTLSEQKESKTDVSTGLLPSRRHFTAWLLLAIMRINNTIALQDLQGRVVGEQRLEPGKDGLEIRSSNWVTLANVILAAPGLIQVF
ncbi:MAG: hypothetical protein Q9194_004511 [Teloschistes cf. exilis]